jgi:hypothetical protein
MIAASDAAANPKLMEQAQLWPAVLTVLDPGD